LSEPAGVDRSYVDIMFQAIRSLQAEVAKLKNTMKYGMYSYTGSDTAMSRVVGEYTPSENEPLWAIEESDLSPIDDAFLDISERHNLVPSTNVEADTGVLYVKPEGAKWIDPADQNGFKAATDAKLFLYLTMSNMNAKINI